MRRTILLIILFVAAVTLLWVQHMRAQQPLPEHQPLSRPGQIQYEVKSLFPHETAPAQYQQVDQRELQAAAEQGWELVSVMPYIYRNEERGTPAMTPRPMVTQTYPAYFFKRLKTSR